MTYELVYFSYFYDSYYLSSFTFCIVPVLREVLMKEFLFAMRKATSIQIVSDYLKLFLHF